MVRNYFKTALRSLLKRRAYSLLNIVGLAVGISSCLLIFQYVAFERSFDDFNSNASQIARIRLDSYKEGKMQWQSATSYPAIGPTLKKDFPEVEAFCRLHDAEALLSNDERNVKFKETKGYFADPEAIRMFGIELTRGNPATALTDPDQILLSESTARKYFGTEEPVGKRLISREANQKLDLQVAGVFKDYPGNSHLDIQYLAPYALLAKLMSADGDTTNATETAWGWYDFYTYVQLRKGVDIAQLEAKLPAFSDRHMNGGDWRKANKYKNELSLIPLKDIHLYSNFNQEAEINGSGQAVTFLFLIAFLILGIAWINYINLATARSLERAKEVGIRKVMGAGRSSLIAQFLVESFILNLSALALVIGFVFLLTPTFNQMIGRGVDLGFELPLMYWLGFILLFLTGTFLSGIYPAFVLSGYQPVKVLKGSFKNTAGGLSLRKGLIIGQFATSITLIAGTLIVYQQVQFMRNQKLGANINQTLVINGAVSQPDSLYSRNFQPFKNELLALGKVKNLSVSSEVMGKEIYWTNDCRKADKPRGGGITLYNLGIDYDFIPAYTIDLKAGRNFSKDFPNDKSAVILNEQAVKLLDFESSEKAINQKIVRQGKQMTVVGVVSDFHQLGLKKPVDPMVMVLEPNVRSFYSAKMEAGNSRETLAEIEQIWNKYFPTDPFSYFFLDDFFNQQYMADTQFGLLFGLFSFLAILIACFGLLGLSAYNVLQRSKEIGIRKVMGASIQNLLVLLSKDFLRLVIFSFVIAIPTGWYLMQKWLNDFAFRIEIQWWVFALAGIAALFIALITVGFQALKAAVVNPVNSLRTE